MRRLRDSSILWHVENDRSKSSILRVDQVQALKKRQWYKYKTTDLDYLQQAPALLGWSADGALNIVSV